MQIMMIGVTRALCDDGCRCHNLDGLPDAPIKPGALAVGAELWWCRKPRQRVAIRPCACAERWGAFVARTGVGEEYFGPDLPAKQPSSCQLVAEGVHQSIPAMVHEK